MKKNKTEFEKNLLKAGYSKILKIVQYRWESPIAVKYELFCKVQF